MSETHAEPRSDNGRWLYARRLKIALGIAVLEGIFVAFASDFSQWTVIIISIPIIGFYIFALIMMYHLPFNWLGVTGDSMAHLPSYMLPN